MSSSDSAGGDGSSTSLLAHRVSSSPGSNRPRRPSVEEDFLYQQVMTSNPKGPPETPPPYTPYRPPSPEELSQLGTERQRKRERENLLPEYSASVDLVGVWEKKVEIVDCVKRAEGRQWRTTLVELRGTSLNFYAVRKDWGWDRTRDWAMSPSPDNPPWAKKAGLIRSYNLQYAEVGIASDYRKRRYVIRLRAETDQFLISCIEPTTFVRWLDGLFAAIAIAHPLEDREYPPDQSIPRSQRARLLRAYRPTGPARATSYPVPTSRPLSRLQISQGGLGEAGEEADVGVFGLPGQMRLRAESANLPYSPSVSSSLLSLIPDVDTDADPWPAALDHHSHQQQLQHRLGGVGGTTTPPLSGQVSAHVSGTSTPHSRPSLSDVSATPSHRGRASPRTNRSVSASTSRAPDPTTASSSRRSSRAGGGQHPSMSKKGKRLRRQDSTFAHDEDSSGKWSPEHEAWSDSDDLRYARLCHDVLLFLSPRKSDFVVLKDTKWSVDWETGRMTRVLPPSYKQMGELGEVPRRGQDVGLGWEYHGVM